MHFEIKLVSWHKKNSFTVSPLKDVLLNVNIVSSHTFFLLNANDIVKARILPWGQHIVEKVTIEVTPSE